MICKDVRDGQELLASWQERTKQHHFEGDSGVRALEDLVQELDPNYSDIHEFLADNPGAQQAIVEFIAEWLDRNPEWRSNLRRACGPADGQADELTARIKACISLASDPDPDDLANQLADGDRDLQDDEGGILEWVTDLCEELSKQKFCSQCSAELNQDGTCPLQDEPSHPDKEVQDAAGAPTSAD